MPPKISTALAESYRPGGFPDENYETQTDEQTATATGIEEHAEDINNKIRTMLAATEALKPGSSRVTVTNAGDSKKSRVVPAKVLKKISTAISRFYTKHEDVDLFKTPRASMRSAELRRNEDVNFNHDPKLYHISGAGIKRKPLPENSHILRGKTDTSMPITDSTRSGLTASIETTIGCAATMENPFDSEAGFEGNLEGRILSAIPEAFSTPRLARPKLTLNGHAQGTPSLQQEDECDLCSESSYSGSEHECEVLNIRSGRSFHPQTIGESQFVSVKKHPSPDKGWLEALSHGFQTYQSLKATSAPDEDLDELAGHFVFPPKNGSDAHMRLFNGHTAHKSDEVSALRRTGSPTLRRNSRAFSSMERSNNSGLHMRQACPFRPANLDANNPDELQ